MTNIRKTDHGIREAVFDAFVSVRDNFPKNIVTLDEFDMSRDGIRHRYIRDFLLAEEWN